MLYASAVIIFNKKGEVLLVQRSAKCDTYPEYWCFPGGRVDEGETAEVCAVREVLEETALEIKPEDLTYLYTVTKDTDKDIQFFASNKYKGEVVLDWESMDFKWASRLARQPEPFLPTPVLLFDLIRMYAEDNLSYGD